LAIEGGNFGMEDLGWPYHRRPASRREVAATRRNHEAAPTPLLAWLERFCPIHRANARAQAACAAKKTGLSV
jgi:hypothetical protein